MLRDIDFFNFFRCWLGWIVDDLRHGHHAAVAVGLVRLAGRERQVHLAAAAIPDRARAAAAVQDVLGRRDHLRAAVRRVPDPVARAHVIDLRPRGTDLHDVRRHLHQSRRREDAARRRRPATSAAAATRRHRGRRAAASSRRISRRGSSPICRRMSWNTSPTSSASTPRDFKTRQELVAAIHERRQLIAALDREAMLDVVQLGPPAGHRNASKEQIAQEIVRDPLDAVRRAVAARADRARAACAASKRATTTPVPLLIKRLKKQEGFFSKLNRKRRAMLGSIVSNMIGEDAGAERIPISPAAAGAAPTPSSRRPPPPPPPSSDDQGRDRRVRPVRRHRRPHQEDRRQLHQPEARRDRDRASTASSTRSTAASPSGATRKSPTASASSRSPCGPA